MEKFAKNGRGRQAKQERCLEMGIAILKWGFSRDYSWFRIGKKAWCVYLSFVNKHVLQNNCLNETWDGWNCIDFNSVESSSKYIKYLCN